MKSILVILGALITAPPSALAQTAAPVIPAAASVDPVRLAAARSLIDTMLPPATRSQMLESMVRPMMANMQRNITEDTTFAKMFADQPRARELFREFLQRETDRSLATMREAMPGMWEAMARAYARRFDVAQMGDIKAFFETPTGRIYMQQAMTIMSDPDVAAWQQQMMHQSLAHMQEDVASFAHEIAALQRDKK